MRSPGVILLNLFCSEWSGKGSPWIAGMLWAEWRGEESGVSRIVGGRDMGFKQGNGTVAAVSCTGSNFVEYVFLEVLSAAQSYEWFTSKQNLAASPLLYQCFGIDTFLRLPERLCWCGGATKLMPLYPQNVHSVGWMSCHRRALWLAEPEVLGCSKLLAPCINPSLLSWGFTYPSRYISPTAKIRCIFVTCSLQ
jgi:hypothetical protein